MEVFGPIILVAFLQAGMIISPGSDYALVMRTVGRQGKTAGMLTALGLGLGAFSLLLLSVFGINSLFTHYPFLVTIISYAGAVWLIWQAILCFLPKDKAPKLHNLGSFWTGFTNHFINIEMVIFYIVIISQLSSRDVTTSIQLMIATEMALFTAIWFILISHLTGKIPNKDKVLDSLAIRITFGLLFLMSAVTLIKIT
ncbi:MAG: LysE family transporter [Patescibacteria group bacterium]